MSARYYLHRRTDTGREKTLRLIITRGGRKIPVSTTMKVKASQWSQKMQGVKAGTPGRTETNAALDRLRAEANALALLYPDDDDLKAALVQRMGTSSPERVRTLSETYDDFMEHRRTRVKASTMQTYEALREHLLAFIADQPNMKPADITSGFVEDFQTHMIGRGVANSTVNKYARRLVTFLSWLAEREIIDKVPAAKPLQTAQNHVIRLTLTELTAFRDVDLSREQTGYEKARDIFLFQTYTGQRFGDVMGMKWSDLRDGKWYLVEQKTNVVRPLPLAAPALEIIEKYRGTSRPLPRLSMQRMNDFLKSVARLAGIDAPVTIRTQKGGKVETAVVPKHEAITSHVGRKTFISLMMEAGLSTKDLLGLTHSDLRSLKHYAGASEEHVTKAMRSVFGETRSNLRRAK